MELCIINNFWLWFLNIELLIAAVESSVRKYNIDKEAFKLYGEDVRSILASFRKTSQYLDILSTQTALVIQQRSDIMLYAAERISQDIQEMFTNENITQRLKSSSNLLESEDLLYPFHMPSVLNENFKRQRVRSSRQGDNTTKAEDDLRDARIFDNYITYSLCNMRADLKIRLRVKAFEIIKKGVKMSIKFIGDTDSMSGNGGSTRGIPYHDTTKVKSATST